MSVEPKPDPDPDDLDSEDVAAINQSEREIASGQDMDWKTVSAGLRRDYLRE